MAGERQKGLHLATAVLTCQNGFPNVRILKPDKGGGENVIFASKRQTAQQGREKKCEIDEVGKGP